MASTIGEAYVQIVPETSKVSSGLSKTLGQASAPAGASAGKTIAGKIVGALAVAGIGKAVQSAISEGAKLEQSFGGLDTIFGDASESAKNFAMEASNMGISANTYAEQAVSMGAALKQAFGGDVYKAAESANIAIADIADNAAKMGTPVESLTAAFQGFAKGQYQLLDNLKIGYGGTKTEMLRLLADAEKFSGVKYDINNLGDVYEAIHVIQGELGLTGVAAAEASETISGSFGALKASATNLLATLVTGGDISTAMSSLFTNAFSFAFKNLIPALQRMLEQLPVVITGFLTQGLPMLAQGILSLVPSLLNTVAKVLNNLASSLEKAINNMANDKGLSKNGMKIVTNLASGIVKALPSIGKAALRLVGVLLKGLAGLPAKMLQAGWDAIKGFVSGLKKSVHLPKLHITWTTDSKMGDNGQWIKIPKPTLSWYKTGGIFSSPSVIGVGEAGPEAVIPIDRLADLLPSGAGGGTLNLQINLDGRTIGQTAIDFINGQTIMFGASPVML